MCGITHFMSNRIMRTIGERIRQARQELGWSAQDLALRVGYKTQSGISNLENRASGSGGNKIGQIAKELGVPLDWLINGPDAEQIPFVPQKFTPNPRTKLIELAKQVADDHIPIAIVLLDAIVQCAEAKSGE